MNKKTKFLSVPGEESFELIKPLIGFKEDIETKLLKFPFNDNVFLMMKFRRSNEELGEYIIENLENHGLRGVRADQDEWNITKNIYNPIAVLYCCKYGIALFDEPEKNQAYSPNVAYELGMMHYQKKDCLILRHTNLPQVPFDLIKDLYITYQKDLQVRKIIASWIKQIKEKFEKGYVEIDKENSEGKPKVASEDMNSLEGSGTPQIKSEAEFKDIIIKAVHNADFSSYKGLYKYLKDQISFKIEGRTGKKYIILAHYWSPERGMELPSEQIEKYFNEAEKSKITYIITTNALGLTQRAHKVLKEFNRKFEKQKLFVISGCNKEKFIQKFKKIVNI